MALDSTPVKGGQTSAPREHACPGGCGPIAGVVRSGDDLIAPGGADLSAYCIHCGRPSAGKPRVLRYVPRGGGSDVSAETADDPIGCLIFSLLLAVFAVLEFKEARAARRANANANVTVTYGLCDRHARRRRRILWAAGVALLLSIGLFAAGLWAWITARYWTSDDTTVAQSAMIAGAIFSFLAPLIILTRLDRGPHIAPAQDGRVLIKNAGRPFLDAQTRVGPGIGG